MKRVTLDPTWPDAWKYSYPYDLLEIYGDKSCRGYSYAYENRRQHTLELVQKVAPLGAKVLDVAAAQGNFSLALAELGYDVTWNDLRENLAGYVRMKYESGIVHFAPGNVFQLGLESCFDVVLATEIIEHVAHPDDFLTRIAQLVKPGGYIVMTTPNGCYFRNKLPKFSECQDPSMFDSVQFGPNSGDHIFLLHLDEIAPIAEAAGLQVQEIRLYSNPLTNGHMKSESLLKILPKSQVDRFEALTKRMPLMLRRKIHTGMAVVFWRPND